jgi:hypothetical protein
MKGLNYPSKIDQNTASVFSHLFCSWKKWFLKPQEKDGRLIHQSSVCFMNQMAGETRKRWKHNLVQLAKFPPVLDKP